MPAGPAPAIDRNRRPLTGGAGRAAGDGTAASSSGGLLQSADRRGVLMALLTAGAAVVGGSVIGNRGQGGTTQDATPTGNTLNATITAEGLRFVPDTVDVTPGDRLPPPPDPRLGSHKQRHGSTRPHHVHNARGNKRKYSWQHGVRGG